MPIRPWIDAERSLVRVEVWGAFSTAEMLAAVDDAVADPDFRPGFHVLSDHTGVTDFLTPEQARRMVGHLESLRPSFAHAKWARS